jgi:hypothetical protein
MLKRLSLDYASSPVKTFLSELQVESGEYALEMGARLSLESFPLAARETLPGAGGDADPAPPELGTQERCARGGGWTGSR